MKHLRISIVGLLSLVVACLASQPIPATANAAGAALLPDLRMEKPLDPRINVDQEGHHLLKFGTAIWNIGEGRLQIRLVEEYRGLQYAYQDLLDADGNVVESNLVGEMLWHPEHDHYHMKDVVVYELRRDSPSGPVAASSGKLSICFIDFRHIPAWPQTAAPNYKFAECYGTVYGITPGWMDEYPSFLPYQWVDITGVSDGEYYLVQTVDIEHTIKELDDGDESNNVNWVKVRVFNNARNVQIIR
jgi:hypothetical protein